MRRCDYRVGLWPGPMYRAVPAEASAASMSEGEQDARAPQERAAGSDPVVTVVQDLPFRASASSPSHTSALVRPSAFASASGTA